MGALVRSLCVFINCVQRRNSLWGRNPIPLFTEVPPNNSVETGWVRLLGSSALTRQRNQVSSPGSGGQTGTLGCSQHGCSMDLDYHEAQIKGEEQLSPEERRGAVFYFWGVKEELKRGSNTGLEAGSLGEPWLCPLLHPVGCMSPTPVCRMGTPPNAPRPHLRPGAAGLVASAAPIGQPRG